MILNGWLAVIYWKLHEIPFWQATITLTIYWSFTLLITYGTACGAIGLLKKWEPSRVLAQKFLEKIKGLKIFAFVGEKRANAVNWLIKKGSLVIGFLTFVPLLPELPTITIIAARIIRMKYALIILLAGNAFRVFVLCYAVYWGLGFINH